MATHPFLKVAGFHLSTPGRFCLSDDTSSLLSVSGTPQNQVGDAERTC
jgi:hypothetical protein